MYDLDLKLRQKESTINGTLAYEFRALEAVLISVTLSLEKEFEGVSEPVVRVLRELEEDIDRDKLRYLLIYSKKLGSFEQKARLVRNALEELLEADDDLSGMYLTEKAEGKTRKKTIIPKSKCSLNPTTRSPTKSYKLLRTWYLALGALRRCTFFYAPLYHSPTKLILV